jgi:hypothetical protein
MPMARPTTCIFCGGKPTTIEDIFPKWLHRYLGNPPTKTVAIHSDTGAVVDRRIPTLAYTQRAKITCRPCNNNFVSLFDTHASPLLKEMFDGTFNGTLDQKTRMMLARWAMKTALLIPYIEAKPTGKRIPTQIYHEFRASGGTRNRVLLLMGQYRPGAFLSGADWLVGGFGRRRRSGTITRDPELQLLQWYGVSFFIKNLVWQVFGVVGSEFRLNSSSPEIEPFVVSLTGPGSVRWPPPQTFDDSGLIGFTKVFWRFPAVPP